MQINVLAINSLNRWLIPRMGAGSSILFVGSTLSEKAVPGSFSYVVSKHAPGGHDACHLPGPRRSRHPHRLRLPGLHRHRDAGANHVPADAMDSVRGMSAFSRLIEPAEIADALLWAATSPVINGAVIHANLGQVER